MLIEIRPGTALRRTARAPYRDLPRDALLLLRSLRDHPRDAGLWGEPAFAREVDRIRAQLAPIRDRRGLAASYGREAFRVHGPTPPTDPWRPPDPGRVAPPTRSAGSNWGTGPAARHGPRSSPTRPDAAEAPRPLSFADAPLPDVLHDPARRSGRRRDAVASAARPGRLCPPARLGHLFAAAARQARQRPRRAGHPRGAERDRRPGDGDAGRPSGRRLARERSDTTRSARSSVGSRTATAGTWSWR